MTTICLNMIVKNESRVITRLLESVYDIIDFYVICDTGSTDNTVELIKLFFEWKKIDGIIFHEEFSNFSHNRNVSLQKCTDLTDYVLLLDADMVLEINGFDKNSLVDGNYTVSQGSENFYYDNVRIVKNDGKSIYHGVTHEFISCPNKNGKITKDRLFIRDLGDGGSKQNKFERDKKLLLQGISDEPGNGRYYFYLANTCKDLGQHDEAITHYKKRIEIGGWFEELYFSCLKLYELIKDNSRFFYLTESYSFNPKRIEGIFELVKHHIIKKHYQMAYMYYTLIQDYYENEYYPSNGDISTNLFSKVTDYTFNLPYYMIILCDYVKKHKTAILMYRIIFKRKSFSDPWHMKNLLFNLQFYKNHFDNEFKKECYHYINFINEKKLITVKEYNDAIELVKPPKVIESLDSPKILDSQKPKILFYVGFSDVQWNLTYSKSNALGGSEKAVCFIAENLQEYEIVISGDVIEETVGNIQFVNRFNLKGDSHFKSIVVSRYVSFFTLYPNITTDKLILMAHDICFMNNVIGSKITSNEIVINNLNKIDQIVYLTEWQKNHYHNVTQPETKNIPSYIINNGVVPNTQIHDKIKNSFIYTSMSYRGLKRLLDLWGDILKLLPNATLNISSYGDFPKTPEEFTMKEIIDSHRSITHHGKLSQEDLYSLSSKSEFWLYPCIFEETSCITALEMLASEVICLYYPLAGLTETMSECGIQIQHGNEINEIEKLTESMKRELRKRGKEYSLSCSWKNRAVEWSRLIIKKKWVFYYNQYNVTLIKDYISNLNNEEYQVFLTNDKVFIKQINPDKITVILDNWINSSLECISEPSLFVEFVAEFSFLQLEPLNLPHRINCLIHSFNENFKKYKIYDYSKSNIFILNENGFTNCEWLPYRVKEKEYLSNLNNSTPKEYDFGYISHTKSLPVTPPRRNNVLQHLIDSGFTVHLCSGWGEERDTELAKCKVILNIHGQINDNEIPWPEECSNIFEHIRCDRLLESGFKILSEDSLHFSFTHPNLTVIKYSEFFEMKPEKL